MLLKIDEFSKLSRIDFSYTYIKLCSRIYKYIKSTTNTIQIFNGVLHIK